MEIPANSVGNGFEGGKGGGEGGNGYPNEGVAIVWEMGTPPPFKKQKSEFFGISVSLTCFLFSKFQLG